MAYRFRPSIAALAVAALLAFPAADAAAQVCVGVPGSSGQNVLRGLIGFPQGGNHFGVEFHHHLSDSPMTLSGTFIHQTIDNADANINWFGAGLAYDLSGSVSGFPEELGFCAVADIRYGNADFGSTWEIPFGVSFGGAFPLGDGGDMTLMPYATPAIYHTRFSNGGSVSSTDLDMILGATMVFTGFHVGLDLQRLFRNGSSFVTLRGGITL
jgi:hypothetical protein